MNGLLQTLPPPPSGRHGWPWTEETSPELYGVEIEWPSISIVTPSFQQAEFLEETIRSILLQNYPRLQLIIMDGGSTDGSRKIIERYAPWIDHWESEADRGQSHAINKGLAHCNGDWFNWINSDDLLLPRALLMVGKQAAGCPRSRSLICGRELMGETIHHAQDMGSTRTGPTVDHVLVNHRICQQATFMRLSTVCELGGVREDLHYVMDLELLARVIGRHGIETAIEVPETLALFRIHPESKTYTVTPRFRLEERALHASWATALHLNPALVQRIKTDDVRTIETTVMPSFDASLLESLLAEKYWWNELIELNWSCRKYPEFRYEVRLFRENFPDLRPKRGGRLFLLSWLPVALLRILSAWRA